MSESKARLTNENDQLKREKGDLTFKLVRLLAYVINMKDDHPDLDWPPLPDDYAELIWRYAGE